MDDLFTVRNQLVQAVYATERAASLKGSDVWRSIGRSIRWMRRWRSS